MWKLLGQNRETHWTHHLWASRVPFKKKMCDDITPWFLWIPSERIYIWQLFKENIERGVASIKESLPQYDIYFWMTVYVYYIWIVCSMYAVMHVLPKLRRPCLEHNMFSVSFYKYIGGTSLFVKETSLLTTWWIHHRKPPVAVWESSHSGSPTRNESQHWKTPRM